MVKTISVSASYDNKTQIFECRPHEFLDKIAECFQIDVQNVELYTKTKGLLRHITIHDITDLMKIEILPKNPEAKLVTQRTLRSYFDDTSSPVKSVDTIIAKLTNNSPLTGQERKSMVQWLQINSANLSNKRKCDQITSKPDVTHRKVQVNISATNSKDSFCQTDLVNIAPDQVPAQEEQISNRIKKLAVNADENSEEVARLMRESFDDRRSFIFMKSPPVFAVKDKYPLLFSINEVKNELGRIFYSEKCSEFINNMHKYAHLILQKCNPSDELYLRTEKSIERAHTDVQKQYARVVGSIFILTKIMDEQWRFIHLKDYPNGSEDVYPHIDASCHSLKEVFFDNFLFSVVVEGQQLCETSNMLEAVLCLVASFFIFNIDYPESCRRTLTVFEKLYLGANDTKDLDELTLQMIKLLQLEAKPMK